jgi:adenylate kinase family enzyme
MPAYLIIGPSGSGKTTVGDTLRRRGYKVIETDNTLGAYYDRKTGKKNKERPPIPITQQWLDQYAWNWDGELLNDILETNKDETIFFCGVAHNENSYFKKFDLRFALSVDDQTLIQRLQKREPERWVSGSPELNNQLAWNKKFREFSEQIGAVLIDSSRTAEEVADSIEAVISRHASK